MNGEARFNQDMYEVVQEITRQLLVSDGKTFEYRTSYGLRSSVLNVSSEEQVKLLNILNDKGVIRLNHYRIHNPGTEVMTETLLGDQAEIEAMMTQVYEITASKEKLDAFAEELIPSIGQHGLGDKIMCALRLDDLDFKLTVGDYGEQRIGRLHQDRSLYKVMSALSTRPSGTDVNRIEVFPNSKGSNLWQIFVKSKYGYLTPFFKHSRDRISFQPNVELPKAMVLTMVSKINEKYRNNFDDIVKDLQR
ncbi:MAG TPA: hypothetical protein VGF75_00605 [Candidatus Saccharimonadales bacterium]|jgi:hypothetical protein